MINRPSYAQLTLELTRRSLQSLPTGLCPAVTGVLVLTDAAAAVAIDQPVERVEHAIELRRWRRKDTRHSRMAVR